MKRFTLGEERKISQKELENLMKNGFYRGMESIRVKSYGNDLLAVRNNIAKRIK